ncbi:peptidase domain-containing ABC transporter [Dyadobacter luteus]|uniref:peptidase domain-containing ABC transporter n=1 Tax=Dyadobacter luteus TaxID=2259619 RepID=UPI001E2DABA0|nr:peptidase domain-containing ABC transporter [Dyadobacter luteus]
MNESILNKTFTRQHDQKDCGVACLISLIRFYGGDSTFEQIRRLSGTDIYGTSMLGLKEAAIKSGFEAEGCQADFNSLLEHGKPVILHVALESGQQHYIVFYGKSSSNVDNVNLYMIGDPESGLKQYSEQDLLRVWKSRICLTLELTTDFTKTDNINKQKRQWFLELLKDDYTILFVSALIGLVGAILSLSMAIYSQQLIDKILPSKDLNKIIISTTLLILILFTRVGISALRQYLLLRQHKELATKLNISFYNKLLNLPKSFFDSRKIGDFITRLNDTARISNTTTYIAGNILIDVFLLISSIGLLFYYQWVIGIVCVIVLPLYYYLISSRNDKVVQAQSNVMTTKSTSESSYINTLLGIADIQTAKRKQLFYNLNDNLYTTYQDMLYRSGIIKISISNIAGLIAVFFIATVLSISIYEVQSGMIKVGELTAILATASTLIPVVSNLALISIPINEAKVAYDRMYEFAFSHENPAVVNNTNLNFESLKIDSLSYRFPGKPKILDNICLSVSKGEIISIVGENGGGKSLICQIINKFYIPESESVFINNEIPLSSVDDYVWRNTVCMVPQNVHVFNGNVLFNVCLSSSNQDIQEVFTMLQEYGFLPFFESLPQGLMTELGEDGIKLSGGQKQIIGLARALACKPKLLILDEITSSMDRYTERFVLDLLALLKRDMGVIFITHRLHTLKNICERIYVLENGRMIYSGSHQELMISSNLYSEYWYSWAEVSQLSAS